MTEREIIEGNKLIAEFMGYSSKEQKWRNPYPTTAFKIKDRWFPIMMLEYHTSWDWLIPVVEKIENLGYSVFIQNDCCWIRAGRAGMRFAEITNLKDSKIEAVFATITEFINYYNTTKQ